MRTILSGLVLCSALLPAASAGSLLDLLLPKNEVEIITVTDTTPTGALLRPASPANPVFYMAVSMGFRGRRNHHQGIGQARLSARDGLAPANPGPAVDLGHDERRNDQWLQGEAERADQPFAITAFHGRRQGGPGLEDAEFTP